MESAQKALERLLGSTKRGSTPVGLAREQERWDLAALIEPLSEDEQVVALENAFLSIVEKGRDADACIILEMLLVGVQSQTMLHGDFNPFEMKSDDGFTLEESNAVECARADAASRLLALFPSDYKVLVTIPKTMQALFLTCLIRWRNSTHDDEAFRRFDDVLNVVANLSSDGYQIANQAIRTVVESTNLLGCSPSAERLVEQLRILREFGENGDVSVLWGRIDGSRVLFNTIFQTWAHDRFVRAEIWDNPTRLERITSQERNLP